MTRDLIKKKAYDKKRYKEKRELRLTQSKSYYKHNKEYVKKYKQGYYKTHKEKYTYTSKEKLRRRLLKIKQLKPFVDYKRTLSCAHCKLSGRQYPSLLDFHHVDPTIKSFRISSKPLHFPNKEILDEINKCIVLCSNCHRKVHTKIFKQELEKLKKENKK